MRVMTVVLSVLSTLPVGAGAQEPADMVLVKGGTFTMGSTADWAEADEAPKHEVELGSFLIGRHEVTVSEFAAFVAATGYTTTAERDGGCEVLDASGDWGLKADASWRNPYYQQGDDHPVVCVSWYDAIAYCNWLSAQASRKPCYSGDGEATTWDPTADGYRLPTEAEWEYAATSRGRTERYGWGQGEPKTDGRPAANIRDESFGRAFKPRNIWTGYDDGFVLAAPVGSFPPTRLGLHDISGNVYEWCWDFYGEDYYAQSPRVNPTGPDHGKVRACRDRGFLCNPETIALTNRGRSPADHRFHHGGFRLARTVQ